MSQTDAEPDSQPTKSSLIRRVTVGDAPAWERMIELYEPRLRAWCRVSSVPGHSIHDVIQETWLSVSKSIATFESKPGSGAFRAWLFQILRRRIADHRRSSQHEMDPVGGSTMLGRLHAIPEQTDDRTDSSLSLSPSPSSSSGQWRQSQRLSDAMKRMEACFEPRTWRAFVRCVMDGQTTDKVAEELAMSAASVRQSRSRVLRMLKKELESPSDR